MKREHWWPIGIAATLLLTVAANVVLFVLAAQGDGVGAVPDYYARAVRWDSTQAEAARSRALGWGLTATLASPVAGQPTTLTVGLTDAAGQPVDNANVRVAGYAVAHANATQVDTALTASASGYRALLAVPRVEWYEFRLTADRGGDRFVSLLRCLPGQACQPA